MMQAEKDEAYEVVNIEVKYKGAFTTGCEGRKGAKCFFTPIGPIPGPPPPCGMQNVL